ncbi:hypothetical protein [Sphingobacterium yanglingense]|uniref:Uncharacterized protein n=1 Tax=Sphingobacterium yanglingense TaxID=1437280 RepID=A0A4R6WKG5_9SPHI|nr:hypothetical protein [Sphingobacterium yanglingense]TDQ78240.1 hypothetical protein CLV99_2220 [Sphingobacterium yanglingense]
MEKKELYPFLKDIQIKITQNDNQQDLIMVYDKVDEVIKDHDFYHQTPYFLSEWLILKEQVLRSDSESLGYFERFLENIMYESATGVYSAYADSNP